MTSTRRVTVAVIAKAPVPGQVKTRMTPELTPQQAAAVATASLQDTLTAVRAARVAARVVVLDGDPWADLDGLTVLPQHGAGLDDRLAHAFADTAAATSLPVLLIGMDTPQVTPDLLEAAADALLAPGADAVLGLATDGGWWALGLRVPDPALLRGVPMSTDRTGAAQAARLETAGLLVTLLPELTDIDTVADLAPVAALVPAGRLAALLPSLLPVEAGAR